jgi:hypothetical protein
VNDDNFNDNPTPYMNFSNIRKVFNDLEEEYSTKIKILNDIFAKIYSILEENNIKHQIIDDMMRKHVNDAHIFYEKTEGNFIFTIHLHLINTKKEPSVQFTLRNTKTSKIYNDVLYAYRFETLLSNQFMMVFKNVFGEYYLG